MCPYLQKKCRSFRSEPNQFFFFFKKQTGFTWKMQRWIWVDNYWVCRVLNCSSSEGASSLQRGKHPSEESNLQCLKSAPQKTLSSRVMWELSLQDRWWVLLGRKLDHELLHQPELSSVSSDKNDCPKVLKVRLWLVMKKKMPLMSSVVLRKWSAKSSTKGICSHLHVLFCFF